MQTSRRQFLQASVGTSSLLAAGATVPNFVARSAAATDATKANANILVVVQLSGGNDGLNTVVPFRDPLYDKNRLGLKIDAKEVLKLDDEVGLHPGMKGFAKLAEVGRLAVVQGVGFPNPDRSHFSSMDIWHTAERAVDRRRDGWLGRAVEHMPQAAGGDSLGLHLGAGPLPLALSSRTTPIPSVESLDGFRLCENRGTDVEQLRRLASAEREAPSAMLDFLRRTTLNAYDTSGRVQDALRSTARGAEYPNRNLARKLENVAKLIDAELETRIYYVSLDGFDTHANQRQTHANLLTELSDSVAAFLNDLETRGHLARTTVLMFSEFGRRVKENASLGTDHGAAAPLFIAGASLKSAVIGKHPRLDDLDREGDLKFHTDFRSVYAALLERLGIASRDVLSDDFHPPALFS